MPSGTFYDGVDWLRPVTHVKGSTFTGCVRFGRVSAVDARGSVKRGFDNVAGDGLHGCSLLVGQFIRSLLPPSV